MKRLREIAEAATPGPWELYDANDGSDYLPMWSVANDAFHNPPSDDIAPWIAVDVHVGGREDAEHIATFDPPTVLALIEAVRLLQDEHDTHHPLCCRDADDLCHIGQLLARLREVAR